MLEAVLIAVIIVATLILASIGKTVTEDAQFIRKILPILEEYTKAFTEVKTVTNRNSLIYREWGKQTRHNQETIAKFFTHLEIIYNALNLTPPDPKILESDEEQMEDIPPSIADDYRA